MPLQLIESILSMAALQTLADERFGDMVKAVVDVETGAVALGCELHVDAEQFLMERGSQQENLWGINLYPGSRNDPNQFIEFDSMINLRPAQGNKSRGVENAEIQKKITDIIQQKIATT